MNEAITFNELIRLCVVVAGVWGFYKVIMEIVKQITSRHDREQKWDEMANRISTERAEFGKLYDARLDELEKKINDNHADTEAKLQQIYAEQYMLTDCMSAVLDGLHQLNCNGKVTTAIEELGEHIKKRAYGMK